jgi:hypothetical protein
MNLLKDIGSGAWQVLKTVAPTIAATASGPFAPLVGPLVAKIFGSADPKSIEPALLSATPEQLLALKQADNDLQVQLKQLGISEEKLAFDDTEGARSMNIQTKDPTAARLAWLIVGGFISISAILIGLFVLYPQRAALIDSAAWTMIGTLLGYFGSEAKQVAAFYFGSSADSQAKTATLSEIAKS